MSMEENIVKLPINSEQKCCITKASQLRDFYVLDRTIAVNAS